MWSMLTRTLLRASPEMKDILRFGGLASVAGLSVSRARLMLYDGAVCVIDLTAWVDLCLQFSDMRMPLVGMAIKDL